MVALKRTGCDMWQLECLASNVTASVHSDHLLHVYMVPVFSSLITRIIHHAQPMSHAAVTTRPYCGLVGLLDTRAPSVACPRRGNRAIQIIGTIIQQKVNR